MTADNAVEAMGRWFEHTFPCRRHSAQETNRQMHVQTERAKRPEQNMPDGQLRNGERRFVRRFGYSVDTDLKLPRRRTSQITPIEHQLIKHPQEYGVLHAMGQAIYYSRKANRALALVADQGGLPNREQQMSGTCKTLSGATCGSD